MFGLKKSKLFGSDYNIFDIPNTRKVKLAIHNDGNFITLIGLDKDAEAWYRLGDREDLKPKKLKNFGLTSCRDSNKEEQEEFVKKVVEKFAN